MQPLEDRLEPGEWFIFAGRLHWIRFIPPALAAAAAVGLGWWLKSGTVAALAVALALAAIAVLLVERFRSNYVVTNRRLLLDHSVLRHRPISLPLDQISDIILVQEWMGHWAKTARLRIRTTDRRSIDVPWLWRARTFRRLAFEQRKRVAEGEGSLPPHEPI